MKIPGYQIKGEIGHGGMATVYQAVQTSLERTVALKVMAPALAADTNFSERFQKEAKTVARLVHPNILAIHDIGNVGPYNYIAMEYVSGGDLKKAIRAGIIPDQMLRVVKQIAAALDHAHQQGVIHRDIKPENILFRQDGTAVLTDFGIAKSVDSNTQMTVTGMSIGTPRYMSPEQAQGKTGIDGSSDLYSLGVVLYEALTGKAPFEAETPVGIALKHVQAAVPDLPDALSKYQPLIDRLMAKHPDDRYSTGSDLIADIERLEAGKKLSRPATVNRSTTRTSAGGQKWLAMALVMVMIAGAGIYLATRKAPDTVVPTSPAAQKKQRFSIPAATDAAPKQTAKNTTPKEPAPSPLPQEVKPPATVPQQERIRKLLSAAELDLSAMRLTNPKENNAAKKFRNVLALEPDNQDALKGLDRLVGKYLMLSEKAVSSLSFDKAEKYLDTAAQFNRKSTQIAAARKHVTETHKAYTQKKRAAKQQFTKNQKTRDISAPKHGDRYSNDLGMHFVFVGPGRFTMGSQKNEPGRDPNEIPHSVVLSKGYWLQTTEVTQAQWARIMSRNPSHFKGNDLPVDSVSWKDAQQFITRLNQRQGRKLTFRLPTEAEWEYAARAGSTSPFSFGKCLFTHEANYNGQSSLPGCAKGKYPKKTVATGTLARNPWGFYDMHGNVHEWCQDWLGAYPRKEVTNPTGPGKGRHKIIRGGSWRLGATACRSAARNRYAPTRRSSSLGFRLAAD